MTGLNTGKNKMNMYPDNPEERPGDTFGTPPNRSRKAPSAA